MGQSTFLPSFFLFSRNLQRLRGKIALRRRYDDDGEGGQVQKDAVNIARKEHVTLRSLVAREFTILELLKSDFAFIQQLWCAPQSANFIFLPT